MWSGRSSSLLSCRAGDGLGRQTVDYVNPVAAAAAAAASLVYWEINSHFLIHWRSDFLLAFHDFPDYLLKIL